MRNYFKIKRIFDVCFALVILTLSLPILAIITIFLYFFNHRQVFYFQQRLGQNETIFKIIKFKSMNDKMDTNGNLLPDSLRITPFGQFLRRSKFDEFPQFINVLKGDMSIVGPRPCLPSMRNRFGKLSSYRFKQKPGLTSLAAIKGSIFLSWEKKGIYDYIYYKKKSTTLDFYIIYRTIQIIIIGEKKLFSNKKE